MFYLLLLTETTLCLADNTFLPPEFKNHMTLVHLFSSQEEAELFLHQRLSFDDLWDFGLGFPNSRIMIGHVYHRL